jgi:Rieske 2Fe-2S family protein
MATTTQQPQKLEPTLPASFYLGDEVFALEKEHLFGASWMCVAREEQVPHAGDSLVVNVVGESILVVRNREGALRGFYNVCRHRGAELCMPNDASVQNHGVTPTGGITSRGLIRCPYHSWVYDLDGALVAAPHIEADALCKTDFSLYPVGVATWGGFIFVHLTPQNAVPLAEQLGAAIERTERYPLATLRIGYTRQYVVDANWKVLAENYNECYHCAGVHPELCDVVPAFRQNGGASLDWDRGIPHREGAVTYTRSGNTTRKPFPGLNDDEQVRHKGELIYPNFFLSLACDHATAFLLAPKGPGRTEVTCHFLFSPEEIARDTFDPSDAVDFWDLVNRQDWLICERVQRGMRSRAYQQGFYAPMEDLSLDIRRYIQEKLGPYLSAALPAGNSPSERSSLSERSPQ